MWTHRTCLSMSKDEYLRLGDSGDFWFCDKCALPNFTDSYFSSSLSESGDSYDSFYMHLSDSLHVTPVQSPGLVVQLDKWYNSYTGSEGKEQCGAS